MRRLFQTVLMIGVAFCGPLLAQSDAQGLSVLRAERGDSFTNLFGSDWQKAFDQNRVVVWKDGDPVSSPDVLIEGQVLRVTRDVALTPRALARLEVLESARARMKSRMESLAVKYSSEPDVLTHISELQNILNDDLRFVADVDFIDRRLSQIENLDSLISPAPIAASGETLPWVVIFMLVSFALAIALSRIKRFLSRRVDEPGPSGTTRFDDAWRDLRSTLDELDEPVTLREGR